MEHYSNALKHNDSGWTPRPSLSGCSTFKENSCSVWVSVAHELGVILSECCNSRNHAPVVGLPCRSTHIEQKHLEAEHTGTWIMIGWHLGTFTTVKYCASLNHWICFLPVWSFMFQNSSSMQITAEIEYIYFKVLYCTVLQYTKNWQWHNPTLSCSSKSIFLVRSEV